MLEAKLDSLGMDKVPSVPFRATAVNPPTVPLNPFGPAGGEARVTQNLHGIPGALCLRGFHRHLFPMLLCTPSLC